MSDNETEVSVVMPCLDEAGTLGACIEKAQQAIAAHGLKAEIVVADNGSADDSPEIARACGARLVRAETRGYGAALMAGIEAARGRYVVMGDCDGSYDFGELMPFVEKLRAGHALVMGCRLPRGGGRIAPGAMPWSHRVFGNPALSALGRLFFDCPVSDFNCGLRGFRREAILALDLRATGMEYAYEMVVKARLTGQSIAEVPVTLLKDGRGRPAHLRTWRDGWRTLRLMLLLSPYWLFLVPGCGLLTLGALAGGLLLRGPFRIGGIGFDTNTLLVAAMAILVGFKLVAFALFAKVFATSEGLLPEDPLLKKAYRFVTLELGIASGAGLTLLGFALLVRGVAEWQRHGFGALSYPDSLRIVIPAITALTLGIEIVFSSFFLSMLGLRRR